MTANQECGRPGFNSLREGGFHTRAGFMLSRTNQNPQHIANRDNAPDFTGANTPCIAINEKVLAG